MPAHLNLDKNSSLSSKAEELMDQLASSPKPQGAFIEAS
jgi:hypothetical protein